MILTTLALLPALALLPCQDAADPTPPSAAEEVTPPPAKGIELIYLGDQAYLLRSRSKAMLVDAFLGGDDSLPAMPPEVRKSLSEGEGLFDRVRVSIATHEHATGFRLEEALEFLRATYRKRGMPAIFEAPPELGSKLKDEIGLDYPGGTMITRRWQKVGEENMLGLPGMRINYLNLPHVGDDERKIEHLALKVQHAGMHVLFLGHGALSMENLEPYQPVIANVDVALVPFDQILDDARRKLLQNRVAPLRVIATGVPTKDAAELARELEAVLPGVIVPTTPLESHVFLPRPKPGGR